ANNPPVPSMQQHQDVKLQQLDKQPHRTGHWLESTRLRAGHGLLFRLELMKLVQNQLQVYPRHSEFLRSDAQTAALHRLTGTASALATIPDEFVLTRQSAGHIQPDLFRS